MKTRLQSARNVVLDSWKQHPTITVGLSLLGLGLFAGVYYLFFWLFRFAARADILEETAYQIFYLLLLFLFAGAVPFIASTLLHSSEYSLLFHAPVPPRSIIAAKLIDATVVSSLQFLVLGVPAIVACAAALRIGIVGWLLVPLIIALFVLLPAILTALGLLLLLGILGMKRMKSAITVLNALMAVSVCLIFILETQRMPIRLGMLGSSVTSLSSLRVQTSLMPHVAPSSWFVSLLLALRSAQIAIQPFFTYFMLILVVCSTVFALCLALGERLISAASVQEETEGAGQVTEAYSGVSRWWYRFFSPPIAAILRKDLLYVSRDSILLSQLMMPALLFIVPFALLGRGHGLYVREELFPFACGMVAIILFMQTSILSLSSIGLENRSFWQFLASPNTGRQLLWSKFLMSTGISGGIAIVLMLFTLLVCGMDGLALLLFPMGTLISAAGLCGLGVGISAMFPRFIYENPAHRVSTWAMILGFFGSVGYMLITTVLFVGAVFLSNFWETPLARYAPLIALVLHLLITIYLVFVSLIFGAKRIEKYAWEH